jgi:O-acetyl-ADP-ribose deacetylase (regulator of RNase III)
MKHIKGDLIEADVDVLVHVCNNHHVMGSGIAYFLKKKFPQVYEADLETPQGDESKMGTCSTALISDNRLVCNLYAMWGIGNNGNPLERNLSYDHFYNGLFRICEEISKQYPHTITVIGLPKYVGCCRAGGSWEVVEAMIKDIELIFSEFVQFEIYELENGEMKAIT